MLKSIVWYLHFFLSLILSIPCISKVKSLDKKGLKKEKELYVHNFTTRWANSQLKYAGVTVNVHGTENLPKDRNVLFISNHQGNFDIPIIMSKINIPKGFVSKVEVEKIPIVRTWMNFINCVLMDRSSIRKSGEAIVKGIRNLKSGYSIVIFPEGTRSKGDKMNNFKAGSFKLATKSKVPIVPITINGSYKIMENNSAKWIIKPATVDLFIHPMIETASLSKEEQDQLPKMTQDIISSKLPK